jgi:hypothetical protein
MFREGIAIISPNAHCGQSSSYSVNHFVQTLPYNESLLLCLFRLIPLDLSRIGRHPSCYFSTYFGKSSDSNSSSRSAITSCFSALFLLVRAYANFLTAEISLICTGGTARCICLGSTDGLSTSRSAFFISYQPVIVPVGSITLGRIMSVVGSILDPYIEIFLSSNFRDFNTRSSMSTEQVVSCQYESDSHGSNNP